MAANAATGKQLSTTSPNTIAVFFAAGSLAAGPDVGIEVKTGAVSSPTASIGANADDEIGVANGSTTTQTPGKTTGPNLVNVTQSPVKDAFGTILSYAESYTFDALASAASPLVLADIVTPGAFVTYDSDNTSIVCGGAGGTAGALFASWSSANPNTVTCASWLVGSTGAPASLNQQVTAISAGVQGATFPAGTTGAGPALQASSGVGAGPALTSSAGFGTLPNTHGYIGITGTSGTAQSG
jgi:hypothetical protein